MRYQLRLDKKNKVRTNLIQLIHSDHLSMKKTSSTKINSKNLQEFETEQCGNFFIELRKETYHSQTERNLKHSKVCTLKSPSFQKFCDKMTESTFPRRITNRKTTISHNKIMRFNEKVLKRHSIEGSLNFTSPKPILLQDKSTQQQMRLTLSARKSVRILLDKEENNKYTLSTLGFKTLHYLCNKLKSTQPKFKIIKEKPIKQSKSYDKKEIKRFSSQKSTDSNKPNERKMNRSPDVKKNTINYDNLEKIITKYIKQNSVGSEKEHSIGPSSKLEGKMTDSFNLTPIKIISNAPRNFIPNQSDTSDFSYVTNEKDISNYSFSIDGGSKQSTNNDFKIQMLECHKRISVSEYSIGEPSGGYITEDSMFTKRLSEEGFAIKLLQCRRGTNEFLVFKTNSNIDK